MKVDLDSFKKLALDKYINIKQHPTKDLLILNYTPKCQYESNWTEETLMCRGLITDLEGNIKARPFKKFFNLGERGDDMPIGDFEVYSKLDGSLGILYWTEDEPHIATRGSFESEQASKGTSLLRKCDTSKLDKSKTYLFEIIYPENRIVVDYGVFEGLVLLAIIDTETGKDEELNSELGFAVVERYHGINDISQIKDNFKNEENKEGFVVKWSDGFRLKVKLDEYVRLHRLLTQCTARSIWDLLRTGTPLDELLERVPDEFYNWVKTKKADLETSYADILYESDLMAVKAKEFATRKEQAEFILKYAKNYSGIVFKLLDGKEVSDDIWKMLRPAHEIPFKTEI